MTDRFLDKIHRLAADVDRTWRRGRYHHEIFPAVAYQCLQRQTIHEFFKTGEVLQWIRQARHIPRQLEVSDPTRFGQPPITLYQNPRFLIDLYFWVVPKESIHDHRFSGAFTVLSGESLHCLYTFSASEKPHPFLFLGHLNAKKSEWLRTGDVRAITAGPRFIHRVWHLSWPTVSVVVRTHGDEKTRAQYEYNPSGVAHTGSQSDLLQGELSLKRMHMMEYLHRIEDPAREKFAMDIMKSANPFEAFLYLNRYFWVVRDLEKVREKLRKLSRYYGRWIEDLENYFRELQARPQIHWDRVREEDQRFLLALLVSLQDRRSIYEMIRQYAPGKEPEEFVLRCLDEISKARAVDLFLPTVARDVLRSLLRGLRFKEARQHLSQIYWPSHVRKNEQKLRKLYASLQKVELLRPLMTGP